jgi:diguanylate cyclase (GGDEF)-like protein
LADQQGCHFALLALDLDHFKPINDLHGHAAGDLVLKIIGQRLLGCVRDKDLVTRVGGDEFLILLAAPSGPDVVEEAMRRIRKAMLNPINIGDLQLEVGTSIGFACYPQDGKTLADLSRHADIALYAAKREAHERRSAADNAEVA